MRAISAHVFAPSKSSNSTITEMLTAERPRPPVAVTYSPSRSNGALGEHRRQCEIVTVEGIPASARKIEGRTSSV